MGPPPLDFPQLLLTTHTVTTEGATEIKQLVAVLILTRIPAAHICNTA